MSDKTCDNCGSDKWTLFEAVNEKKYCVTCMRKRYPPYMSLMQYKSGKIFNVETGSHEEINDPKDLEICGWEVKMIQELTKAGSILIYLEYYGDVRCGRCDEYNRQLWGWADGSYCLSQACMKHKQSARNVIYPCWKSFYLQWKYRGKVG